MWFFNSSRDSYVSNLEHLLSKPNLCISLVVNCWTTETQLQERKNALTTLLSKVKHAEIQIVFYGALSNLICDFTNDCNKLTNAIHSIPLQQPGVNLKSAIELTRKNLKRTLPHNSNSVVILITGPKLGPEDPTSEFQKLLEQQPTPQIVALSVGSQLTCETLKKMLPSQMEPRNLENYSQFTNLVNALKVRPPSTAKSPAKIEVTRAIGRNTKSDLILDIQVKPVSAEDTIPAGSTVIFLSNEWFYGTQISLEEAATFDQPFVATAVLQYRGNPLLEDDFPSRLWWEFQPAETTTLWNGYVETSLAWLTDGWKLDELDRDVNILLWGNSGCGKSLLRRGICRIFSSEKDIEPVEEEESSETCSCVSLPLEANWKVSLLDPCGEQAERNMVKLNQVLEETSPFNNNSTVDAVILVVPIGTSQNVQNLQQDLDCLLQRNMKPAIVINYMDTIESEEEKNFALEMLYKVLEPNKNRLHITLLDNYQHEKNRNTEKDLKYWKVLSAVIPEAKRIAYLSTPKSCVNEVCQNYGVDVLKFPFCPFCGTPVKTEREIRSAAGSKRKMIFTQAPTSKIQKVANPVPEVVPVMDENK